MMEPTPPADEMAAVTTADTMRIEAALAQVRRLREGQEKLRAAVLHAQTVGATVQDIADAAGMHRTSVYRMIPKAGGETR